MNRRAFLTGLVASTTLAACPTVVEAVLAAAPETSFEAWFVQWIKDASTIIAEVQIDELLYGTGAWIETETYPFITRVNPSTLPPPKEIGGLFSKS